MLTAAINAAKHLARRIIGSRPDPQEDSSRSPHWPSVRATWLKSHPACAACDGKENLQVHHKYPFSWPGGKQTELDERNFLTLCEKPSRNCHLWIGHLGDFKSRNPRAEEDAAATLAKISSRPYPKEVQK